AAGNRSAARASRRSRSRNGGSRPGSSGVSSSPGGRCRVPGTGGRPGPTLAIGWDPMDTLPPAEVAQLLGTSPNRVRQLLRDRKLMAVPGSGNGKIPADFVQDGIENKNTLA